MSLIKIRPIEDNLLNSDDLIREKVTEMGDEDYVALSDRLIQQGVEQGTKKPYYPLYPRNSRRVNPLPR